MDLAFNFFTIAILHKSSFKTAVTHTHQYIVSDNVLVSLASLNALMVYSWHQNFFHAYINV